MELFLSGLSSKTTWTGSEQGRERPVYMRAVGAWLFAKKAGRYIEIGC